ncbi:MAG: alginate export family protein, partial [Anaerohalosphaera sp.]|nr:alginate export family protein [Anaerohalosphaera sp.]
EPLTVVVGRQDIILGQGWLVLDGTPSDGSTTIFFDAIRATYALSDEKSVDLIYIHNYDDTNQWLQPLGHESEKFYTNGRDERGVILYVTDKSMEDSQLEYYYIYKEDKRSDMNKYRVMNGLTTKVEPDAEIHTFGGAFQHTLDENWSYRVEGAKQFGEKGGAELKGWGTNNRIKYAVNDDKNTTFHVDYEYLSGDNKMGDSSDQGFDPLWGEWPQWGRGGDLSAYLWGGETTVGEVTNLHRLGFGHTFKPAEKWSMDTIYNLMWADENNKATAVPAGNAVPTFNSHGSFRGQMITEYIRYKCCEQLSAHLQVDYFIPGSYYAANSRDNAVFARLNLEYVF